MFPSRGKELVERSEPGQIDEGSWGEAQLPVLMQSLGVGGEPLRE
jgi:hypothetical protein